MGMGFTPMVATAVLVQVFMAVPVTVYVVVTVGEATTAEAVAELRPVGGVQV